jgi:hypothetical protein
MPCLERNEFVLLAILCVRRLDTARGLCGALLFGLLTVPRQTMGGQHRARHDLGATHIRIRSLAFSRRSSSFLYHSISACPYKNQKTENDLLPAISAVRIEAGSRPLLGSDWVLAHRIPSSRSVEHNVGLRSTGISKQSYFFTI